MEHKQLKGKYFKGKFVKSIKKICKVKSKLNILKREQKVNKNIMIKEIT